MSSRFIDASMYRDTCHAICIAIQFATIAIPAILQHSCVFTDINCQSAKNYQCPMSSHPQQTASSYSQLKSIKLCRLSVITTNGVMTNVLSVVTGSSSRRQVSTLAIVFSLPVTFADLGKLNWPLEQSHFFS